MTRLVVTRTEVSGDPTEIDMKLAITCAPAVLSAGWRDDGHGRGRKGNRRRALVRPRTSFVVGWYSLRHD